MKWVNGPGAKNIIPYATLAPHSSPLSAMHGCQVTIARFLDCMCLALRAAGLWLRYATLQNLIPSFPWKGGIKFCHLATLDLVYLHRRRKYVRSYAYAHMTSHQQNMRYSTSAPFIPFFPSVALALNSLVSADGVSPDIRRTHGVFEQHLGDQHGGSVRVY